MVRILVGEWKNISSEDWQRLLEALPATNLCFTYISEADIGGLSDDQKNQFRAAIRLNRERYTAWYADPAQKLIAKKVELMWWNPKSSKYMRPPGRQTCSQSEIEGSVKSGSSDSSDCRAHQKHRSQGVPKKTRTTGGATDSGGGGATAPSRATASGGNQDGVKSAPGDSVSSPSGGDDDALFKQMAGLQIIEEEEELHWAPEKVVARLQKDLESGKSLKLYKFPHIGDDFVPRKILRTFEHYGLHMYEVAWEGYDDTSEEPCFRVHEDHRFDSLVSDFRSCENMCRGGGGQLRPTSGISRVRSVRDRMSK